MQQTSRRERKKEETRKKILDSALELFFQNGFANTTVDDITNAADIAKGTFYNYFSTKEAVLCDLMDNVSQERGQMIWESVVNCEDTRQRLAKTFETISSWVEKYPELVKTYMEERIKVNPQRKTDHMELFLMEILKMGQESGDIRNDLDPMQLVLYLDGIFMIQILLWYENGANPGLFEKVMHGVDFFLKGALSTD